MLVEEPEAHVHAQRQLKLIQSLENEAESKNQQIIMTTHSPLLASVVKLGNIILVKNGQVFPMAEGHTKLKKMIINSWRNIWMQLKQICFLQEV